MGTHEERIEALGPAVDKLDSQGKSYALSPGGHAARLCRWLTLEEALVRAQVDQERQAIASLRCGRPTVFSRPSG